MKAKQIERILIPEKAKIRSQILLFWKKSILLLKKDYAHDKIMTIERKAYAIQNACCCSLKYVEILTFIAKIGCYRLKKRVEYDRIT